MPADLPISREKEQRELEDEMARWMTEFQVRPGKFGEMDANDAQSIAELLLDDSPRENEEFVNQVSDKVREVRKETPSMDRYPVLHVTRQNLREVEETGELPEGFFEEFSDVVANYIDGFIPDQEITSPRASIFEHVDDSETAGSYLFRIDRSRVLSASGLPDQGSSAAEVSAHETMHKNNIEAIVDDPSTLRNFASIYNKEVPEEYTEFVQDSVTAPVNHDLLGGLAMFYLDQIHRTGILAAYATDNRDDIEFTDHTDEFQNAVLTMQKKYDLEYFDVRDEAICQSVSYFMEGRFEDDFESKLSHTREHYNQSSKYSENAGDFIANHLVHIRSEFREKEGLRGQRFKQVMQNRIPFLKNQENFHKY